MKVYEAVLIETHANGARHNLDVPAVWNERAKAWVYPPFVDYAGYRYKRAGILPERRISRKTGQEGLVMLPYYQSSHKI